MPDSTLISAQVSLGALNAALEGYRVVKQVGHGAMGIVYEAEQRKLARRVALKVLPPNLALRERTVKRFLREAEAMGRLGHANIVDVYEVGSIREFHFFSMRFVEGPPLDRVLRAGPLSVADVISIGIDVGSALAHAHSRGVMHRDVKPANLLRDGDKVVLTDFGLARPLDSEDGGSVTESGDLVGTPLYMAPEQISGDLGRIDARADVWGLGVTLYELLAQHAPFSGQSASGILHAILHRDPPRITKVRPDVPRDLEAVIHKCLEKDPARRYPGAAALVADLAAVRDGRPVGARPPRFFDPFKRWIQRHPAEAGIVAASLLVTIVLGLLAQTAWNYYQESKAGQTVAETQRDTAQSESGELRTAWTAAYALTEIEQARTAWLAAGDDEARTAIEFHVLDVLGSSGLDQLPEVRAAGFELAAEWARKRGRSTAQVLAEFEPTLAAFDKSAATSFRAALLMGLGEEEQALALHRERIEARPDDPGPLQDAARAERRVGELALDRGEEASADQHLRRALALLDESLAIAARAEQRRVEASALIERARCRLDLAEPELAAADLTRVLELDPRRVDAESWLSAARRMMTARAAAPSAPRPSVEQAEAWPGAAPTAEAPATPAATAESRQKALQPIFDAFQRLMRGAEALPKPPAETPGTDGDG